MKIAELVQYNTKVPKISGVYKVIKIGQKYQYDKEKDLWSQKYSLIDEDQFNAEPHLTLTVFAKQFFDFACVNDIIKIENGLFEPRKGNNDIMYYNLTLGKFGKMSHV